MPNVRHDLAPRYDKIIDDEIIAVEVSGVNSSGWAGVDNEYAHHLVAWAPLQNGGALQTTTHNQNRNVRVQSYVQKDGGVNIGTDEWADERVVLLILNRTLDE